MDYYSGTPEPENYSYTSSGFNGNPNNNKKNSFFKTHYTAIMIGLASLIALFMLILFLTGNSSGNVDDVLDNNSNLSELIVNGGTMTPDFMSCNRPALLANVTSTPSSAAIIPHKCDTSIECCKTFCP